ncbi:MAG: hypothetical protein DRP27_03085 [Thermotogae bacterium]|nr:MAG: hypothetical protein DRP27_03085 [Thermotogota bacterium]
MHFFKWGRNFFGKGEILTPLDVHIMQLHSYNKDMQTIKSIYFYNMHYITIKHVQIDIIQ